MMTSAVRPSFTRSSKGLKRMNMLEALALLPRATSDRPANSDTAAMPGVFVSNCTTFWLTASVRWRDAPSGSWR